jgi:hypothetical protein
MVVQPVIPATLKAEGEGSQFKANPGKIYMRYYLKTNKQKTKLKSKGLGHDSIDKMLSLQA